MKADDKTDDDKTEYVRGRCDHSQVEPEMEAERQTISRKTPETDVT